LRQHLFHPGATPPTQHGPPVGFGADDHRVILAQKMEGSAILPRCLPLPLSR
jgi:hypothetical protein